MRHWISAVAVCVLSAAIVAQTVRAEDWKEPADGRFTEKQLTNYLAAFKEWQGLMKAYGEAAEGTKTGVGAVALASGMQDKMNAVLKAHDLQRGEFEWLGGKVFECYGVSLIDDQMATARKDIEAQKAKLARDTEAAKKKVADYEQASKANTRVLTKEQREDALKAAKDNQASALEEAKGHAQEAKDAMDEAAKHADEAKAADALAKNPPADVSADDRADYVKARQEEAAGSRTSEKEATDRAKEAAKAEAESKAKAVAALNAGAHPEIPVTDDEKAQVKAENESALASAREELKSLTSGAGLIGDSDAQLAKTLDEYHKKVDAANLALVAKHAKEVKESFSSGK